MGLERIHQITVSCSFLKLLPSLKDVSPSVFWAHSLGAKFQPFALAGFTFGTEGTLEEVRTMVTQVYGGVQ